MSDFIEDEIYQPSAVKKAVMLANDAIIITTLVISVYGLGRLAYDSVKVGAYTFKNWKKNRNNIED